MNARVEQKRSTRQAIVASAAALLRTKGIVASSVKDVMERAGLTVGGFYAHFDSKEALFTDAIANSLGSIDDLVANADGKVSEVVRAYLSRQHRDNPELGCLLPGSVHDIEREGEPYRTALEARVNHLARAISSLGISRTKALGLVCLMYGALSLSRALKGTALSDEVLLASRKSAAD